MKRLNDGDIVLLIVGASFYSSGIVSPYAERLRELTRTLTNQIVFTGYVNYSLMADIYNMADVVVLPSIWEEPAGMTIIEAMACKKPVITTFSGGIPEYTGNGNCILLKKDESLVENITNNIKKLLSDCSFATKIAENGYHQAIKYNKLFYYKQFLSILNEE